MDMAPADNTVLLSSVLKVYIALINLAMTYGSVLALPRIMNKKATLFYPTVPCVVSSASE
jgi:hypothetical protein